MKLRLFPQENAGPELLSRMARQLVLGVGTMSAILGASTEEYDALSEELHEHESASTDLHFALLTSMRTSFINSLPREDMYSLSRLLNEAIEKLDGAGELIALYRLSTLSQRASDQLEVINRQAELTAVAMQQLSSMEDLEEYWIEILRLAKRAERTHRSWCAELMHDHKPSVYLRHRDVADQLVDVTRDIRRVATQVGSILVKES
ncbi:nuclease PIN [Arthrobacter echini]|uniref:Nuclease PIN n=1 Tax=Arthrobacter echini TaxID=1529066 RepID=A0A4S5E1D7_9MICC|nr:nuclease PIN [Arthrobacter echini]THJ65161.1 nuclease PIN [Arthrobacter echini]